MSDVDPGYKQVITRQSYEELKLAIPVIESALLVAPMLNELIDKESLELRWTPSVGQHWGNIKRGSRCHPHVHECFSC